MYQAKLESQYSLSHILTLFHAFVAFVFHFSFFGGGRGWTYDAIGETSCISYLWNLVISAQVVIGKYWGKIVVMGILHHENRVAKASNLIDVCSLPDQVLPSIKEEKMKKLFHGCFWKALKEIIHHGTATCDKELMTENSYECITKHNNYFASAIFIKVEVFTFP